MSKQYIPWDTNQILWDNNPYTWDEVIILEQVITGSAGISTTFQGLSEENKKKLITLVCKVKGETFTQGKYKEYLNNKKLLVEGIKLSTKKIFDIEIENINFK